MTALFGTLAPILETGSAETRVVSSLLVSQRRGVGPCSGRRLDPRLDGSRTWRIQNVKKLITPLAMAACVLAVTGSPAIAQAKQESTPAGVTEKTIAEGETLFKGAGICFTCHGQDAKGVPGLGANLTDSEWIHSDGSYESIVETITKGTTSSTGAVMPPRGGPNLTDEQVKAVAAYVWSLSHKPAK